ncbi:3-isopropylmalate dehydratase large subunit [Striga asiatica]|uniref:3-isopropylmalate dehydratase large subunit n=1 Tax=Striga asiatica TaxID=4170 RepID=A0A5A7Q1W0_STRAF|nr:3-isopropylmalate dehydratase large subunit [Striga asiatica]
MVTFLILLQAPASYGLISSRASSRRGDGSALPSQAPLHYCPPEEMELLTLKFGAIPQKKKHVQGPDVYIPQSVAKLVDGPCPVHGKLHALEWNNFRKPSAEPPIKTLGKKDICIRSGNQGVVHTTGPQLQGKRQDVPECSAFGSNRTRLHQTPMRTADKQRFRESNLL